MQPRLPRLTSPSPVTPPLYAPVLEIACGQACVSRVRVRKGLAMTPRHLPPSVAGAAVWASVCFTCTGTEGFGDDPLPLPVPCVFGTISKNSDTCVRRECRASWFSHPLRLYLCYRAARPSLVRTSGSIAQLPRCARPSPPSLSPDTQQFRGYTAQWVRSS